MSDEDTMMMKSVMQAQGHGTQSVMSKQNMTGSDRHAQTVNQVVGGQFFHHLIRL
jgi:hypothetical protein